jgi:membrane-bound lytic murein transglycosylase MltF
VLRASSYHQHLQALNLEFGKTGLAPVEVVEADPNLATEDLLQLVDAGLLDLTVADSHIAALWAPRLPHLVVRPDLAIHQGGQIAWAVRPDNPKLRARLDDFVRANRKGTLLGNILLKRYYGASIADPIAKGELDRLAGLRRLFEHYASSYGFDWLAIAAQAYQESGLDHAKRSPAGAVGIMQIRPATAADPNVGIADVTSLENNIHAGVKYSAFLRERYFSDPDLRPEDRLGFTLAAYNAGPRRIGQARDRAKAMGLDPNRWFQNVEYAALDLIGRETVRYVANIHKYYVAYRLTFETQRRRLAQLDIWRQPQE